MRSTTVPVVVMAVTGVIGLVGCGGGGGGSGTSSRAAAASATTTGAGGSANPGSSASSTSPVASGSLPIPGVINLLLGSSSIGTSSSTGTSSSGTSSTGASTGSSGAAAAPSTGAALFGTIPPDPATGFDGSLFFVGERLVPGSLLLVTVNGVPTKTLPATFYSSQLLSTYVHLTVPATYTFTAIAPDGTSSASVTLTVPAGSPTAVLGLDPPAVQMVYPTRIDGSFAGTVWLLGDQFMPGAVLTIQQPNLPPMVVPLLVTNERTAAWVVGPLAPGSATLTVTNPTLLSSTAVTLPVGTTPPGGAPAATPSAYFAGGVTSPFLGTVTVYGSDLALGASMELRPVGGSTVTTTPLVRLSSAEAWWTLVYPTPGSYEVRVVNPGGAASPWTSFDVR